MQHLFTPVQIVKTRNNSYSQQQLSNFSNDFLTQITQPQVLSLADQRKQIINWFKGISILQRQLAATIYSPQFAALVCKMFQEWERSDQLLLYSFSIEQEQYVINRQRVFKTNRTKETTILKEILLVSHGQLYEGITFSEALIKDVDSFFNLMDQISGGIVHELSEIREEDVKEGKVIFEIETQQKEPKCIIKWISQLLLKQIFISFLNRNSKELMSYQHLKLQENQYSKLWKELTLQERTTLIRKSLTKKKEDVLQDYMFGVGVSKKDLPLIYVDIHNQDKIVKIVNCPPKDLIYHLVFSPLAESLTIFNMYKVQIILEIEAELSNFKQKEKEKKKKKKKGKKNQDSQKTLDQQENQNNNKLTDKIQKINSNQTTRQQSPKQNQNTTNNSSDFAQNNQPSLPFQCLQQLPPQKQAQLPLPMQAQLPPQIQAQLPPQIQAQLSLSMQTQLPHQMQTQPVLSPSQRQQIAQNSSERQQEQQIIKPSNQQNSNWILQGFYQSIKQQCQRKDKFRKIILNRIIFILAQFKLTCSAFGSFAYGLTIPDSDLDIIVDSSILNYFFMDTFSHRQQIISSLQLLKNLLQQKHGTWASQFILLPGAKTPLLKFKADAGQHFQHCKPTKLRVNGKRQKKGQAVIQVDLTIQPFMNVEQITHLGMDSTQAIKQWIQAYPLIPKLIIVIKSIIRQKGLHIYYEGGISSYATILLLTAFFKHNHHAEPNHHVQLNNALPLFSMFLKIFSNQHWTIDVRQNLPLLKIKNMDGPVLINPLDGRNLLQRSFKFIEVVSAIQDWKSLIKC